MAMLGASLAILLTVAPPAAHHSTAVYEMDRPITVTGTVTRFVWANPHAFMQLKVTDDAGKDVVWEIEMSSPNHLSANGWMRTTVQPGDKISCTGGLARGMTRTMLASLVELADGRQLKS